MSCFWTDFVGCVEDCPAAPAAFNVATWDVNITGCCNGGLPTCFTPPASGDTADQFNDFSSFSQSASGSFGPVGMTATFDVSCNAVTRTPVPACIANGASGASWTLQGTLTVTPNAGASYQLSSGCTVTLLDANGTAVWTQTMNVSFQTGSGSVSWRATLLDPTSHTFNVVGGKLRFSFSFPSGFSGVPTFTISAITGAVIGDCPC